MTQIGNNDFFYRTWIVFLFSHHNNSSIEMIWPIKIWKKLAQKKYSIFPHPNSNSNGMFLVNNENEIWLPRGSWILQLHFAIARRFFPPCSSFTRSGARQTERLSDRPKMVTFLENCCSRKCELLRYFVQFRWPLLCGPIFVCQIFGISLFGWFSVVDVQLYIFWRAGHHILSDCVCIFCFWATNTVYGACHHLENEHYTNDKHKKSSRRIQRDEI